MRIERQSPHCLLAVNKVRPCSLNKWRQQATALSGTWWNLAWWGSPSAAPHTSIVDAGVTGVVRYSSLYSL